MTSLYIGTYVDTSAMNVSFDRICTLITSKFLIEIQGAREFTYFLIVDCELPPDLVDW